MRLGIVYKAINLINRKVYIGQTTQPLSKRIGQHKCDADRGKPYKFCKAIRKYGIEAFGWEIIAAELDQEKRDLVEIALIEYYDSVKNGYNIQCGGFGPPRPALSSESRAKLSASLAAVECATRYRKGENCGSDNSMAARQVRDSVSRSLSKSMLVAQSDSVSMLFFSQAHAKACGFPQPQISRAMKRKGTCKGFRWIAVKQAEGGIAGSPYLAFLWDQFKQGLIVPPRIERLQCVVENR